MKYIIVALALLMLTACTSIKYSSGDGKSFSYMSSKDVNVEYNKDGNGISIKAKGESNGREEIIKGILGAMK